jgi:Spy/CpxP family protein refolding chaperone
MLMAQQGRPDGRRGDQGGPGGRGGFQFFGGGGGGALGLLQRNDVQEELELLDDQKKQITELREKSGQKMREVLGSLRGGEGAENRRDDLRDTFRKLNDETQAEVNKILLPHQTKRLKQLETQMAMRGRGVLGALGGDLAEKLGISEDQREKLRDKAQQLDNELRKKTAELRKQAQDQLLASLTEEQRKEFNEMIGEPFEFRDEPGQGFGGFGGGVGGPGGPGGGRRGGDQPRNND